MCLLELVLLTKYENICGKTTASVDAFSHFKPVLKLGKKVIPKLGHKSPLTLSQQECDKQAKKWFIFRIKVILLNMRVSCSIKLSEQ